MKKTGWLRMGAMLLTAAVLGSAVPASAFSFAVGSTVPGIGTIVTHENETVAQGLTYSKTTYTDAAGIGQTMYAMEFNPSSTDYFPMVYQAKPSYGKTVEQSIADAQDAGYEVLGGINGEFGSANPENWGTLDSRMITNGRIIADGEYANVMCLAIDNQARFQLVQSEMAYHFYIEGKEVLNSADGAPVIGCINKRYVGTNWWSPYCYFDYETGGATYTNENVKGVEVVFNKLNGTQLMVEGVLQGEVAAVYTDAYATPMTENQFVLYAQNGSENYDTLAGLKVGQKVQIYAEELIESSKEIMKNAVTVSAATYPIVVDGKDNTKNTPNAEDIYLTDAQRTAIGIKADGTMVFLCTAGRGDSASYTHGITLPELARLMIELGCQYAVNLDGGGSTTLVAGDSTKITTGRGVSSSILICKRNDALSDPAAKAELAQRVAQAQSTSYPAAQQAAVNAAVAQANAVIADSKATTADYMREYNDLAVAMGLVTDVSPKTFISLDEQYWSYNASVMQVANNKDGALVLNNLNDEWPGASYPCKIPVSADGKLFFDMTVAGQAVVTLTCNGEVYKINELIAPGSLDAGSGDIYGGGKTFKGVIDVKEICAGDFELSTVTIHAVGAAGSGSKVTVRRFEIRMPYEAGDVSGDYETNSTDARLVFCSLVDRMTLTPEQQSAADLNGDGTVDTADGRMILNKSVGLM